MQELQGAGELVAVLVMFAVLWLLWTFVRAGGSDAVDRLTGDYDPEDSELRSLTDAWAAPSRARADQRRLDAAEAATAEAGCVVCGEPNVRGHGCHLAAQATVTEPRRQVPHWRYRRDGSRYQQGTRLADAVYVGRISDRYGTVWDCGHTHRGDRSGAVACSQQQLRRYQAGLDPIDAVGPRPGAQVPVTRLPILDLDERAWARMLEDAGHRCRYCRQQLPAGQLEREHWIPLSRGGANSAANIVVSCGPCNREKGTMTGPEYLTFRGKTAERDRGPTARPSVTAAAQEPPTRRVRDRRRHRKHAAALPKGVRYPGPCPCGGTFRLRTSADGRRFYGCEIYPDCDQTRLLAKDFKR